MLSPDTANEIRKAIKAGLKSLRKPMPLNLSDWAEQNFYLSSESSYIEGRWVSLPFQKFIMNAISNDDIREVCFLKSARVGATKIMLASIFYHAEHKHRNQCIWQPTDADADEFVKTEIDTAIRDIPCIRDKFPYLDKKHKNNTMRLKGFIGSSLHIRGGKAEKNYRRLSVDIGYLDELSGFDHNVEGGGAPDALASKRVEGATFPKMVYASTPKLEGSCLMSKKFKSCDVKFMFYIPCPCCGQMITLEWGGKDSDYGFKWHEGKPETVAYLCPECAGLFTQSEFLEVWHDMQCVGENGEYMDADGRVYNKEGDEIKPRSVGFKVWTAYSPMTDWETIVREFIASKDDPSLLQSWVNLTLGEAWKADVGKSIDDKELIERIEEYSARVPEDVLILTIGADVQKDRVEWGVKGWGVGEESWWIDYRVHYGNLGDIEFWRQLYALFQTQYAKESGDILQPRLCCIDSGGLWTDEVYSFSQKAGATWVIPTKGLSTSGKPIATFPMRPNNKGVYLTLVGTDTVKDLSYHRLQLDNGAGAVHFPKADWCNQDFFKQLTAEKRVASYSKKGELRFDWTCPKGKRNEVWDIENLNLVAIRILQQHYNVNLDLLAVEGASIQQKVRRKLSDGII